MGLFKFLFFLFLIVVVAYSGFIYGQMELQKNYIEIEVPIKQDINFPIDKEISFPLKTEVEILVNKTFYIKKTVPIATSIFIDTIVKVPMNISGVIVYFDAPIKTTVPVKTSIEINEPVTIVERIVMPVNQNFNIPLKTEILIPIDTVIKTHVPLPWGDIA